MTKLIEKVDSVATRGARRESIKARASLLKAGATTKIVSVKGHLKISHGKRGDKIKGSDKSIGH